MARPSARTPQRRAAPGAGRPASASGRLRRPRHSRPEPGSSCPCRGSAWPPSGHSPGGRLMGADLTALPSGPRAPAARPPPPGRYGRGLCRAPVQPPLAPGGVFSGGPWLLSASSLLPGVAGCTLPRPQGPCPAPPRPPPASMPRPALCGRLPFSADASVPSAHPGISADRPRGGAWACLRLPAPRTTCWSHRAPRPVRMWQTRASSGHTTSSPSALGPAASPEAPSVLASPLPKKPEFSGGQVTMAMAIIPV